MCAPFCHGAPVASRRRCAALAALATVSVLAQSGVRLGRLFVAGPHLDDCTANAVAARRCTLARRARVGCVAWQRRNRRRRQIHMRLTDDGVCLQMGSSYMERRRAQHPTALYYEPRGVSVRERARDCADAVANSCAPVFLLCVCCVARSVGCSVCVHNNGSETFK